MAGRIPRPTDLLYKIYEDRLLSSLDRERFPKHVAVILDGHRRYARSEGLASYTDSYRAGMLRFEEFLDWNADLGIEAVTGWLLSRENLDRPAAELDPYFEVLIELFDRLPERCAGGDMAIRFIGSLDLLPDTVVAAAKRAEQARPTGTRWLTIALGYGGRQEIVDATRDLVSSLASEGIPAAEIADHISAESLARRMYSPHVPDPDLLIRTSGESRLSGFLLWQSAYSEFVFVDVFWPAFRRVDYLRALRSFTLRERRFGK
jgi:short-chain Z-isoprenyl diphosphate synthase